MNAVRFHEILKKDGELVLTGLPYSKGQKVELIVLADQTETELAVSEQKKLRPFGLCAGEFTVPDNFDEPLPEHIIQEFEGK